MAERPGNICRDPAGLARSCDGRGDGADPRWCASSIVRKNDVQAVLIYYHIEGGCSGILAETTPIETFVAHVDRMVIDN
jgi:hypothetical protein